MVDAGLVSRRALATIVWENVRFRLHGSTDATTERVREQISELIAGRPAIELRRMMPEVLAGVLPRIYPAMLRLAYEHQDAGRRVYIATASSQEMADMLSHVLGFDGGIGARSEIVDGRFTGRDADVFTYREGKAQRIRALADAEGLDLAASYAYSDSESDLPMLRLVGHPVAVNPDAELARVAALEGWEVLRFEQLGRRLLAAGALVAMGVVGTAGRAAVLRRAPGVPPGAPRARR
jgi:HAD superfamily hydrolase (TIGR01490 family)